MFGFLRRKKYMVEHRLLIIEDKSTVSRFYKKKIRDIIFQLFVENEFLKKFSLLKVMFIDHLKISQYYGHRINIHNDGLEINSKKEAFINGEAKGEDIIELDFDHLRYVTYVNPNLIIGDQILYMQLKRFVIHESVHLLHYRFSKHRHFIEKSNTRLKAMFEKLAHQYPHFNWFNLEIVRGLITQNLYKFWVEGIAKFYEELYLGNLVLDNRTFESLYSEASQIMKRASNLYVENFKAILLKKTKFIPSLFELSGAESYIIGKHIVFSIKYLDNSISDEHLLRLDIYKFVRLYEELMLKNGYKPVISLYSRKGVFKYKKMIEFVQYMVNEVNK